MGLPDWVNHIAFDAVDESTSSRASSGGWTWACDVVEVDHGFCRSIYTDDPNGTIVEWCVDAAPARRADRAEAAAALADPDPSFETPPVPTSTASRATRRGGPAVGPSAR